MRPADDGAHGALADVLPALAAALDVPDQVDRFGLGTARAAAVVLIDGMGADLLQRYADVAPTTAALAAGRPPLVCGFPSTTATSITTLGTGLAAGEHCVTGYSIALPDDERVLNVLRWAEQADPVYPDLRAEVVPEVQQPSPTVFERAAANGVHVRRVMPAAHHGSGLSRAALRGEGADHAADSVHALAEEIADALRGHRRTLVYGYYGGLDLAGHLHGTGSARWLDELALVERLVSTLLADIPPDCVLAVVADHGMVDSDDEHRVDLETTPGLLDGVARFSGEPRVRHVHARPGAAADVLAAWRETLGDRADVVDRDTAVAAGWYGPRVTDRARAQLGDVVAAARDRWTLVRPTAEPVDARLIGYHGSWSPAERLIPLLVARGG